MYDSTQDVLENSAQGAPVNSLAEKALKHNMMPYLKVSTVSNSKISQNWHMAGVGCLLLCPVKQHNKPPYLQSNLIADLILPPAHKQ